MSARAQRGFTLMEVMIGLAILAGGLAISIATTAANVRQAHRAQALGTATNLARGKMYDLEEELIHDGFQELDQSDDGDFADEGYPDVTWEAKIEKIELPGIAAAQAADSALSDGEGGESGARGGATDEGGGDPLSMLGAGIVSSQFETISSVLEMSIRRVTLTVTWRVGQGQEEMTVVAYFTNEQGVSQAMAGMPAGDAGAAEEAEPVETERGTSTGRRTPAQPKTR